MKHIFVFLMNLLILALYIIGSLALESYGYSSPLLFSAYGWVMAVLCIGMNAVLESKL